MYGETQHQSTPERRPAAEIEELRIKTQRPAAQAAIARFIPSGGRTSVSLEEARAGGLVLQPEPEAS